MSESEEKPLVVIRSLVYNHEPYLRDCLEGFVMQQTSFPFVAVVHDDCSTDGSAAIIREYAEKYPHIIKPVYETENQYSKHDGSLSRAMDEACGKYGAKYYALCEGDDYWTNPHKLQKQVDFLETHPDYTMVCTDGAVRTPDGDLTEEDFAARHWLRYRETRDVRPEDAIEQSGYFILTASIVYRSGLRDDYPEAVRKCHIGDHPLQIMATLKGKVRYFHEKMVVYRWEHPGSWTSTSTAISEKRVRNFHNELLMLQSLDEYSGGRYAKSFRQRQLQTMRYVLCPYPEYSKLALSLMRDFLKFKHLAPAMPEPPRDIFHRVLFLLKRICYYPYYPQEDLSCILLPILRPLYKTSWATRTLGLGPLHIVTFTDSRPGERAFRYSFCKQIWREHIVKIGPFSLRIHIKENPKESIHLLGRKIH